MTRWGRAARFAAGDRVGMAWLRSDVRCRRLPRGRENLCPARATPAGTRTAATPSRRVVPEAFAYAIPAALGDDEAAPLLCAGIIGYRALAQPGAAGQPPRVMGLRLLGPHRDAGGAPGAARSSS